MENDKAMAQDLVKYLLKYRGRELRDGADVTVLEAAVSLCVSWDGKGAPHPHQPPP